MVTVVVVVVPTLVATEMEILVVTVEVTLVEIVGVDLGAEEADLEEIGVVSETEEVVSAIEVISEIGEVHSIEEEEIGEMEDLTNQIKN